MDGSTDEHAGKRDVINHLLFEIATEVANRGMLPNTRIKTIQKSNIFHSWWHLLSPQIESSSDNGRVWR
jgi:hypothetical protein